MTTVSFTENLRRHVDCSDLDVGAASTVRAALDAYFERSPKVRSYVLDDSGAVRHHVVIFVDGKPIADRSAQSDPVTMSAEILIMQALSGG